MTFGTGEKEFDLESLSSSIQIGFKQTAAATRFLLAQAWQLSESAPRAALITALQEELGEEVLNWRKLWSSASGSSQDYVPLMMWKLMSQSA